MKFIEIGGDPRKSCLENGEGSGEGQEAIEVLSHRVPAQATAASAAGSFRKPGTPHASRWGAGCLSTHSHLSLVEGCVQGH